ncbi:hypothetical protein OV079_28775 [Nannocystis pusilla]|uniref:Uncharacterized protein n=1 Tax=Nannocystis pusilla TaxID=889268 RepID=A0A9X3EU39_9BACT|nr:hypothetical protein [Nannocystis pusilla]MCY1009489.1 hypothetical protein [Nannocystis pusilla]
MRSIHAPLCGRAVLVVEDRAPPVERIAVTRIGERDEPVSGAPGKRQRELGRAVAELGGKCSRPGAALRVETYRLHAAADRPGLAPRALRRSSRDRDRRSEGGASRPLPRATDGALDLEVLVAQAEFTAQMKGEPFDAAGFRASRGRAPAAAEKDDAARAGARVSLRGASPSPILTVA